MHLIVGLGNPGAQYALNRHNIGFLCIDAWLKATGVRYGPSDFRTEHKALTQKIKIISNAQEFEVLVAKPQTYMNKSGEAVQALMNFYKIGREKLLVVQDDIDQPLGSMKVQFNRGHGGQNGIRHISELFGAADYHRLKLGVGRPTHPDFQVADYVLANFPKEDSILLNLVLDRAILAIECFVTDGGAKAATKYNGQL